MISLYLFACTGGGSDTSDPTDVPDAETFAEAILASNWASKVDISVQGDRIVVESDGVPDHEILDAYALMNGDTVGVDTYDLSLDFPTEPVYANSTTDTDLGAIGAAISGAVFFNPYEGDGVSIALDGNFEVDGVPFLDSCNGHPLPSATDYHYHGVPYCITDVYDTAGEHSVLLGLALDGFPIYGPQDVDGDAPTDLDDCGGHVGPTPEFPDGIYHYHLSESAPYSIECYHGEL